MGIDLLGELSHTRAILPFLLSFFTPCNRSSPNLGLGGKVIGQWQLGRISEGRGLKQVQYFHSYYPALHEPHSSSLKDGEVAWVLSFTETHVIKLLLNLLHHPLQLYSFHSSSPKMFSHKLPYPSLPTAAASRAPSSSRPQSPRILETRFLFLFFI